MRWARRCSRPLTARESSPFTQCLARLSCRPPPRKTRRRLRVATTRAWRIPPSNKRHNYGHYHQEDGPTHFCKVILAPKLECIPMPLDFTKHFVAVPTEFKLRNNTGCSWKVTVKLMNGRVTLDQGWATYTAVHQIKIGYMVTFKLLTPDTLKVIIFDDDGIEVINKCGKHDKAFAAKE
ncbi:hypothetical protein VPH35_010177 [Triticum aestivum]